MPDPTRRHCARARSARHATRSRPWHLLVSAVFGLLAGCLSTPEPGPHERRSAPRIVGTFEFSVSGIGTDTLVATARRVDDVALLVDRAALGTEPVTGITIANATSSGFAVIDGVTYLHQSVEINNGSDDPVQGLTFIAYTGPWALQETAFRVVDVGDATSITPAVGTLPAAGLGDALYLDAVSLQALSTVAFDDDELAALNAALSDLPFVDAVLPYGFVARSAADPLNRGIAVGSATGRLDLGFRIPHPDTNNVVWRAVAILDDAVRVTLPAEYTDRTVETGSGTVDNLSALAEHAASLSHANDAAVQLTLLGQQQAGDRFLLLDADDWRRGSARVVDLPWRVLPDVRIAGPVGSSARYWLGGTTANTLLDAIDLAIEFKTTGPTYAFTPPTGTETIEYLIVGAGATGASTAFSGYVAGGGGGGGGVVTGTEPLESVCAALPCTVKVGSGGGFSQPSSLGSVSALGGGRGGSVGPVDNTAALDGGSGGGGWVAGEGTPGQGHDGGVGIGPAVERIGSAFGLVTSSPTSSSTLTVPPAYDDCSFMWIHFVFSGPGRVVQPPAGWVMWSAGTRHAILTRSIEPGDPSAYTFTWTGGSTIHRRTLICLEGIDVEDPVVATDFEEREGTMALAPPVAAFRGAVLIAALSIVPAASWSIPSGMTSLYGGTQSTVVATAFRETRLTSGETAIRQSFLNASRFTAFVSTVTRPGTSVGGGGGGASAPGQDGSDGGAGGDGVVSSITGTPKQYGGGGGGGTMAMDGPPAGGEGGGGAGANRTTPAVAGAANSGGGGGGGMTRDDVRQPPGGGGSGIVVVRLQAP